MTSNLPSLESQSRPDCHQPNFVSIKSSTVQRLTHPSCKQHHVINSRHQNAKKPPARLDARGHDMLRPSTNGLDSKSWRINLRCVLATSIEDAAQTSEQPTCCNASGHGRYSQTTIRNTGWYHCLQTMWKFKIAKKANAVHFAHARFCNNTLQSPPIRRKATTTSNSEVDGHV